MERHSISRAKCKENIPGQGKHPPNSGVTPNQGPPGDKPPSARPPHSQRALDAAGVGLAEHLRQGLGPQHGHRRHCGAGVRPGRAAPSRGRAGPGAFWGL